MTSPIEFRRLPLFLVAAGLAALAGWRFLRGVPPGLPVDDAYIHLVYARNLSAGLGLCFNAGEPSLGFSSPLWVFLIRCLLPFLAPETAVRALSFAALLVSTLLVADLSRAILPPPGAERGSRYLHYLLIPLAAALFAFSGNLLWIAFCGMETMVFLALGLLALRGIASGRPGPLTAFSLGLLLLTRIEGAVLFFILLGWWLLQVSRRQKTQGKAALGSIGWFFIPPAFWLCWTAWTWFHFGLILPNTMAGKLASNLFNSGLSPRGSALFLWRHLVYFAKSDPELLAQLALGLLGLILFRFRSPRPDSLLNQGQAPVLALCSLWAVGNLLLHAILFRSTAAITPYHDLRYQVPLFPALCLGSLWALARIRRQAFGGKLIVVFFIVLLAILSWSSIDFWRKQYVANINHLRQSHRAAALWAKANLPEDVRLAGFDIGSLKFFSGRYVIDLGGLTDPAIHPYLEERRVGPFLKAERATHYLALDRPPEEGITGARKDDGALYHLRELARFDAPDYASPVLLHSKTVIIYQIE